MDETHPGQNVPTELLQLLARYDDDGLSDAQMVALYEAGMAAAAMPITMDVSCMLCPLNFFPLLMTCIPMPDMLPGALCRHKFRGGARLRLRHPPHQVDNNNLVGHLLCA